MASPASFFSTGGDQKRKWGMIAKLKQQGWSKGFPDLLCIVPCWDGKKRIVFVEMKRQKGSTVSEEQKEWVRVLEECEEVSAKICRGVDEAVQYVEKLL